MPEFFKYLEMGLQNFEEYQVCAVTVGVVGDVCRALDEQVRKGYRTDDDGGSGERVSGRHRSKESGQIEGVVERGRMRVRLGYSSGGEAVSGRGVGGITP